MIMNLSKQKLTSKPKDLHVVTHEGSSLRCYDQSLGFLFGRDEMGKFKRAKGTLPIFYVYLIIDAKKNTPIYVGKGHGKRVLDSNNRFKKETIYKFPFSGLIEKEAFKLEKDLITVIGRRIAGTGPLINFANGGEGGGCVSEETKKKLSLINSGKVLSEEHKKKIAKGVTKYYSTPDGKKYKKRLSLYNKGKKPSEEVIKKISLANKGKKLSDEHKRKIGLKSKGRTHSEETKRKISEAQKGRKYLDGHYDRVSKSLMGHPVSKETRRKIALANTGKRHSEKTKKKISLSVKKSAQSPETKQKLSASAKRSWAIRKGYCND